MTFGFYAILEEGDPESVPGMTLLFKTALVRSNAENSNAKASVC